MSEVGNAEVEKAVFDLENIKIGETQFLYLDMPRGEYKGLYLTFTMDKLTKSQHDTVRRLRQYGYAVGLFDVSPNVKDAIQDYLGGRKPDV